MIKSLVKEYGVPWVFNRTLYSAKLKMMRSIPKSDKVFEKNVRIQRVNIFDLDVKDIKKHLNELSEDKQKEIISRAESAVTGKLLGFSSIELNYGTPIKWHYNPITKVEVDNFLKWYQIPDFDPVRGDIKVIWEASRFTHFFYFIRAYLITEDDKYFHAFSEQLDSWLQENEYSYGPNYKCGQEASLRMINALMAYSIFDSYGLTTSRDNENIKMLVEGSYKKVLSNFFYTYKCIKNNHTLSEITGLIIGAWACNDNNKVKEAYKLLDNEIEKQFFSDGGYIQYSFNYQRLALQLMEVVLKISEKTNVHLSKFSKELIKNSAGLIYQMQDESGDVPNYGSNDGALIFPVTSCGYRDFRPVVNTISALIDGKRLYKAGDYDEELVWFGNKKIENIPFSTIEKHHSAFNDSGFYSIRHNEGFLMTVLQDFKSRPAQMDQLHVDLWHKGVNIFCDSGTYSYATEIGKKMALTNAHNTLKVPGKEQMKKRGPFLIYDWTNGLTKQTSDESFIGQMTSQNDYEHTRKIEKSINGYLIKDDVTSDGEYCEFNFHTPCKVTQIESGFNLDYKGQLIAKINTDGKVKIKKSYRSLYYMQKEEISCISVIVPIVDKKCSSNFKIELVGR